MHVGSSVVFGEGWGTYRHDAARSGVTGQTLTPPLSQAWAFESKYPPQPAWPGPARRDGWHKTENLKPRVIFDWAFHVVADDGAIYFGSSADDKVYCLDSKTGKEKWSFFTEGPVRLAPTIVDGRVFAGSDDGVVYCLSATDGKLLWKYRSSPSDYRVPGNGRMMSVWPVRTGVLVDGGTTYFCAGLFAFEGAYLCALKAEDGSEIWKHRLNNLSPQGYMLASANRLYVPTGYGPPVVFNREDGKYLHALGGSGGAFCVLTDEALIYGPGLKGSFEAFQANEKDQLATFEGNQIVVAKGMSYLHSDTQLSALNRAKYLQLVDERKKLVAEEEAGKNRMKGQNRNIDYSPVNHFYIGTLKDDDENYVFKGQIDEVRVWRTVRTPEEIRTDRGRKLKGDETGLVGYWSLDEGAEAKAADAKGKSHGKLMGDPEWVTIDAGSDSPPEGHGLAFDGTKSFVDTGNDGGLQMPKMVTVEAWINPAEREKWSGIANNVWDSGSTEAGYGLTLDDGSGVYFAVKTEAKGMVYVSSGSGTIDLNKWHHVAGTYDGSTVSVYVDGELKASNRLFGDDVDEAEQEKLVARFGEIKTKLSEIDKALPGCVTWKRDCKYPYSLVLAGDVLFAGGTDSVAAFAAVDGRTLWSAKVVGRALELAVAGGQLVVSTDKGHIYGFQK
jgi:outer membrane protein assembly factor BamB